MNEIGIALVAVITTTTILALIIIIVIIIIIIVVAIAIQTERYLPIIPVSKTLGGFGCYGIVGLIVYYMLPLWTTRSTLL